MWCNADITSYGVMLFDILYHNSHSSTPPSTTKTPGSSMFLENGSS